MPNNYGNYLSNCNYTFSIKHSDHSGDIIYSLPMVKALAEQTESKRVNFFININEPSSYTLDEHPNGNVILNEIVFVAMKRLLETQPYIQSVNIYNNEKIDFNLDDFRQYIPYLDRGSISKWYKYVIPININDDLPWLIVKEI